jgi:hypothetical protein
VGHFGILGAVAFLYTYKRNKSPRFETGKLRITDLAVMWGDRELGKRSQLTGGLLVPKDGRLFVALSRQRRPTILLDVANEAEGRDILRALELDASQTVAEVRGMSPYFSLKPWQQLLIPVAPVLGIFVAMPIVASLFGPTAMGAAVAAMAMLIPFAIGGGPDDGAGDDNGCAGAHTSDRRCNFGSVVGGAEQGLSRRGIKLARQHQQVLAHHPGPGRRRRTTRSSNAFADVDVHRAGNVDNQRARATVSPREWVTAPRG